MYKLVISDDEGKTIIVPLVRDLITVGRQHGNTIRLTERNVSRQHARLVKGDDGYRVEDLDSYNGVTVNGEPLDGNLLLGDGDRVGIGDYVIAFKDESAAASAAPPAPVPERPVTGPVSALGPPGRLVMMSAPAPGAEFSISRQSVRIGRLEELDLCISHRSISREHARVVSEDGRFEIEDLESANGVRINGEPVQRGTLRSGDILELGQVRFRFVGPGEAYTYEPTVEDALASLRPNSGPKVRTVAAVVATAALAGGVLAYLERDDAQVGAADSAQILLPTDGDDSTRVSAAPGDTLAMRETNEQLARARVQCDKALSAGRYEEASALAKAGLDLAGDDADLLACSQRAEETSRAIQAFEEGQRALAEGRLEDAYFMFAGIPENSVYRQRAEVAEATEQLALQRLADGRKLVRSEPDGARDLAHTVLEMRDLSGARREDAQHLLSQAERSLARSAATPKKSAPPKSKPRSSEPVSPEPSPAKRAKACLALGDQRCVVKALEGNVESPQELALLIETYRALGETRKAVRHMKAFVGRFPAARQATQYKQFIAKHE